jgi:NitT/TauT family transport system substrate-binding protein
MDARENHLDRTEKIMNLPIDRRSVLAMLAASAAGVLLPGGASAQTAAGPHYRVGVGAADAYAEPFFAKDKGFFTKAQLDVELVLSGSGGNNATLVAGNALEVGVSNTANLAVAIAHGAPFTIIAGGGLYTAKTPTTAVVVAKESPVKSAKDLVGKTVAVTALKDLTEVGVRAWLDRNGVDRTKVQFVEVPPRSMMPGLESKRLDAAFIFEPFTGSMMAQGARVIGTPFDAIASRWMPTAWFAVDTWSKDHRALAQRFGEVLTGLYPYANTHYSELIPMISGFSKLSPETLRTMTPVFAAPSFDAATMQPVIDAAVKYGEIAKTFDARTMLL